MKSKSYKAKAHRKQVVKHEAKRRDKRQQAQAGKRTPTNAERQSSPRSLPKSAAPVFQSHKVHEGNKALELEQLLSAIANKVVSLPTVADMRRKTA